MTDGLEDVKEELQAHGGVELGRDDRDGRGGEAYTSQNKPKDKDEDERGTWLLLHLSSPLLHEIEQENENESSLEHNTFSLLPVPFFVLCRFFHLDRLTTSLSSVPLFAKPEKPPMEETQEKKAPKRIDWGDDSEDEIPPPRKPQDHQKRGKGKGKETTNPSYRLRVAPSVQPDLAEESPAREEIDIKEKVFHVRRNTRGFGQDGGNDEGLYAQATEELNKKGLGSHPALRKLLKKYQGDVEKIIEDIESWNKKKDSSEGPQRERKQRRDQRGSSSSGPPKDFPPYVPVVLVDATNSFVPSCLNFPPQYVHPPKPTPKRNQPASRSSSSSSSASSSSSSEVSVSATKKSSSSLNLPAWDADDDLYMDEVVLAKKLEQLRLERSRLDKEIEACEAQIEKINAAKLN